MHVHYAVVWFILKFQEKAISIWESKDFFIDLDPLPGGVEAVKEMAEMEKYVLKSHQFPTNFVF